MAARPKADRAGSDGATASPESPLTRTDTPMDYKALLAPSGGLKRVPRSRDGADNPCKGFVALAVGNWQALPVPNAKEAKRVTNFLRQDQSADENVKDARLTIQYGDEAGNQVHLKRETVDGKVKTIYPDEIRAVHFLTEPGKKQARKYTNADIVKWFKENRNEDLTGPIPAAKRKEFRVANGYVKDAVKVD